MTLSRRVAARTFFAAGTDRTEHLLLLVFFPYWRSAGWGERRRENERQFDRTTHRGLRVLSDGPLVDRPFRAIFTRLLFAYERFSRPMELVEILVARVSLYRDIFESIRSRGRSVESKTRSILREDLC